MSDFILLSVYTKDIFCIYSFADMCTLNVAGCVNSVIRTSYKMDSMTNRLYTLLAGVHHQ